MPEASITVLLPAYDEADNLGEVVAGIAEVLDETGRPYDVVVVDDGSTDGTPEVLAELACRHPQLGWVRLRRNFGKSVALATGFERATGDVVVLMDADGQDDPAELPRMLDRLDEGVDLVTGRRSVRSDRYVKRNTSKLYNWTTARVTGVPGRDFNSGFKVMRREVAQAVDMYGELHRYIPVLATWAGYSVTEVDVNHRPRAHGRSKFGRSRFWRGFLDLITVKFLTTYDARPFHLIGGLGLWVSAVGAALLTWMLVVKLSGDAIGQRPALLAGVLMAVVGVQLVSVGLIAELIVSSLRRRRADPVAHEVRPGHDPGSAQRS